MPETGTTDTEAGAAWPGATNPSVPQMHQAPARLPGHVRTGPRTAIGCSGTREPRAQPVSRSWISKAILVKPFFSATC